jgi:hypothetical protein
MDEIPPFGFHPIRETRGSVLRCEVNCASCKRFVKENPDAELMRIILVVNCFQQYVYELIFKLNNHVLKIFFGFVLTCMGVLGRIPNMDGQLLDVK